jgi:hypothetical protein
MATGENSGTWGDKTNTNLNIINQAAAGYQANIYWREVLTQLL